MGSSAADTRVVPVAWSVEVDAQNLRVALVDGRTVTVPLSWYPRLAHASPAEREHWQLVGGGHGLHWPDLDEDIAVDDLLAGRRSGESPRSLEAWRAGRPTRSSG